MGPSDVFETARDESAIISKSSTTFEGCREACLGYDDCVGFTYFTFEEEQCVLLSEAGAGREDMETFSSSYIRLNKPIDLLTIQQSFQKIPNSYIALDEPSLYTSHTGTWSCYYAAEKICKDMTCWIQSVAGSSWDDESEGATASFCSIYSSDIIPISGTLSGRVTQLEYKS